MNGLIWGFTLAVVAMLMRNGAESVRGFADKLRAGDKVLKPKLERRLRLASKGLTILSFVTLGLAVIVALALTING